MAFVFAARRRLARAMRSALASPAALLTGFAVWLLVTAGVRPLLLPDEGRYASVAREMLLGDALVPTLNGLPFLHKPPLFYWLDMAAMHVFGASEFAARFGAAFGAWLLGAAMFLHLRRWHDLRMATAGLLVLATCPFFFVSAQFANHDLLVAGLITVAVLALVRAVDNAPSVHVGWLSCGWVACACAFLAKGLIGFVLPALIVGPWLMAQGRSRHIVGLLHPLGPLLAIAVAAPWFLAVQARHPGFGDYFFMEQHFRRFTQTSFNNVAPFWFFVAVLPALSLPWSVWLAAGVRHIWRLREPRTGLYAWWVVAVVFFFSLPSSKLVGYVLPAIGPWCAILAFAGASAQPGTRKLFALGSAALCVGVVFAIAWKTPASNRDVARLLGARIVAGDRVVMIDEYLYDVPFYARLQSPVTVLADWADPALVDHDNWKKELHDAARFDPARGGLLLRPLSDLTVVTCGAGATWFVVHNASARKLVAATRAQRIAEGSASELWRSPARACP